MPLTEQDRDRWDHAEIAEGLHILASIPRGGQPGLPGPGPYQLQAEIVACHARAVQPGDTDWAAIARRYAELAAVASSPVVELNRAVAVGMADGPAAGLAIADALADGGQLAGYHLLPAVRADLLRRLDRPAEAAAAYRTAIEQAATDPERRYLQRRLEEITDRRN